MRRMLIGVVLGVAVSLPAGCKHTRANYERIMPGMTRDEVESIVGKPWGHDGNKAKYGWFDGKFEIEYDETGRVKEKEWD